MALHEAREQELYLNILGSDGTLRMTVDPDTEGAVRRDWQSADGSKSGTKYEKIFSKIDGTITAIEMYDGDYGKNIILSVTDGDDTWKISLGTGTPYGEDVMKKLPALDLKRPVSLAPYCFADDNGKTRKGVSIVQDDKKVQNFFYDFHEKKNINGYPDVKRKVDKKTGELKELSKDEWKLYFGTARQFLIEYVEEHCLFKPVDDTDARVNAAYAEATAGASTEEVAF